MFQHEGPARSEKKNALLAGYLALTGGYVNSAGFVLLGIFTSHVTGNVGRLSVDLTRHDAGGALGALIMLGAFFSGAVIASVIIESAGFRSRSNAYGMALALEAALLLTFLLLPEPTPDAHRLHDSEAALICASMGLQNSLVTRLSGAVIRTTHLTGVVTDLGDRGGALVSVGSRPTRPAASRDARPGHGGEASDRQNPLADHHHDDV